MTGRSGRPSMVPLVLGLMSAVVPVQAVAQDFPARPIRMVVGYAPGGATDLMARLVARHLGDTLGQQVVVDNRPGAAGTVGAELVTRANPDGHTLLMAASPEVVIAPSLYTRLPYQTTRDLLPITQVALGPFMLVVNAAVPATDVKTFIAHAKARPRGLNFASGGNGTAIHLTGELFKTMAGVDMVHVPYKGSGPAVADLIAGQVHVMFETIAVAMPHVRAGRLKSLGMATEQRSSAAPDLPTIAESGLPGFSGGTWYGLFAPRATPPARQNRLQAEVARYLGLPETRKFLAGNGIEPVGNSSAQFLQVIQSELAKWAKVVKAAGVSLQ